MDNQEHLIDKSELTKLYPNKRNFKGSKSQKSRGVSTYMKRHYYKVTIDQFEEKSIQVFIDAESEEEAEQKLKNKVRYEKIWRTPRA